MNFSQALQHMEAHSRKEFGLGGPPTGEGDTIPLLFNGHDVVGTSGPISSDQPFSLGGFTEMPACIITIQRCDWQEFRKPTLSGNRFILAGETMRILKRVNDDPLSSEVSFACASVDT